jgi:hypothetical protein
MADEAALLEGGARQAEEHALALRSMLESRPLQALEPQAPVGRRTEA